MVTDAGIEAISRKLTGLRRIYICGNRSCSDRSLIALSSNCILLNEIACSSCDITRRGIERALCHSSSLTSLKAGFCRSSRNSAFNFDDLVIHATGLRELDIVGDDDSERLLCSIAKAGIQLEKLKLFYLSSFFIRRVTTLLRACPTLKHFEVDCALIWISDNAMKDLC
ncbi:hypothetical protein Vadar_015850 [Vaccinium darrowii]|uniref:Uncharacterized protein n=1 Tax=Vaccinium darrowii TaxID=229202 RepID=A0ACB7X177_9ERIC|nr:hypothetical protein Vadar_015850 [Vaccinium darrowii]